MFPFPDSRISSMASPSFFSLILDTSATTLKISSEFVTKHLKNKIPKSPIIIYADGGYSWRIEMKKIGENYYFENGWSNVVKDVHFMFGDFVLFTLVDEHTFDMFVYGKDSCERSLPKKVKDEDDGSISVDNVVKLNVDVVNDDDDVDDSEDEDDDDDDYADDEVYEGKEATQEEDEEDDDDDVGIDGSDPFFILTISKANKKNLRLPDEFVKLAGIEDERSITLKNLRGQESRMRLRVEKVNKWKKLYISSVWADFRQSNDLQEGDECVFKFITKEGKILLAKVTKKNKRPASQSQPFGECSKTDAVKRKRGQELHEDEYMETMKKLRGSDEDYENEDNGKDDGGNNIDGDPFFMTSIFGYKYLRVPKEFMGLPGIEANGSITLKNLKGKEWQIGVLLDKSYHQAERYIFSRGWLGFQRSNKLWVGDKCIVTYIRKEGKFCVEKVTKKSNHEDTDNDINDDDNDSEDEDDDIGSGDINGDPSFTFITSKQRSLRLPVEFTGFPGIDEDGKGTIMLKNLEGKEWRMGVRVDKAYRRSERYGLSGGLGKFMRDNDISVGDECVIKFIRNEGKLCLVKVTKKNNPATLQNSEILATPDVAKVKY